MVQQEGEPVAPLPVGGVGLVVLQVDAAVLGGAAAAVDLDQQVAAERLVRVAPGDRPALAVLAAAVDPEQPGVGPGAGAGGHQQDADLVGAEGPDLDGEGPRPGEAHRLVGGGRAGGDAQDLGLVVAVDEPDADRGGLDDPGVGAGVAAEDDPAGVDAGCGAGEPDGAAEGRQLGPAAVHEAPAEHAVGAAPVLGDGHVQGALVGDRLAAHGDGRGDAAEGQGLVDLNGVDGLGPGGQPAVRVAVQLHQRGHAVDLEALAGAWVDADLGGGATGLAVGRGHRVAHAEVAHEGHGGGLGGPALPVDGRVGLGLGGGGGVVAVLGDGVAGGGGGWAGDGGGLGGTGVAADHEGGGDPQRDGQGAAGGEEADVGLTHC